MSSDPLEDIPVASPNSPAHNWEHLLYRTLSLPP